VLLAIERSSPHGGPFSGFAAARYHAVAPERRRASQQKLRADVADAWLCENSSGRATRRLDALLENCSFTSFPPSRRVRFAEPTFGESPRSLKVSYSADCVCGLGRRRLLLGGTCW